MEQLSPFYRCTSDFQREYSYNLSVFSHNLSLLNISHEGSKIEVSLLSFSCQNTEFHMPNACHQSLTFLRVNFAFLCLPEMVMNWNRG